MYAVLSAIRARNQHNLIFWNEGTGHSIYLDSANSANLALVHLIHSWLVWEEIESTVHVSLPKKPQKSLNLFSKADKGAKRVLS